MAKEILIYGDINSDSATEFMNSMNDVIEDDIVVRVATDGGDPEYGFCMVAKFNEHPKGKKLKVDGKAYSMGTYLCLYADYVEALNVSQFLFHRAAYPDWFEKSDRFTEERKTNQNNVNASLRDAMEAKIDVPLFEKITKVTLDRLFSTEERVDVYLNAKDAKKIGLIDKVVNITPKKKAEIVALRMVAKNNLNQEDLEIEEEVELTNKFMTLTEFKIAHPELYAKVLTEGVDQERDRVGSWLPFMTADTEMVTAAIKEGKTLSATAMSELNVKMFSAASLGAITASNPVAVSTSEVEIPAGSAAVADAKKKADLLAFRNEGRKELGLPPLT